MRLGIVQQRVNGHASGHLRQGSDVKGRSSSYDESLSVPQVQSCLDSNVILPWLSSVCPGYKHGVSTFATAAICNTDAATPARFRYSFLLR